MRAPRGATDGGKRDASGRGDADRNGARRRAARDGHAPGERSGTAAGRVRGQEGKRGSDERSGPSVRRPTPWTGGDRLGGGEGRPSVVVVPAERKWLVRHRRRTVLLVLLAAALAGVAILRPDLFPVESLRSLAADVGLPVSVSNGNAGGPAPGPTGPAAGVAVPDRPDAESRRVDRLLDSLALSLRHYGERRADFALRRLGCDGLARGYRTVDDRFLAATRAVQSAGASLDAEVSDRYQRLATSTDSVSRHFDESDCGRPR